MQPLTNFARITPVFFLAFAFTASALAGDAGPAPGSSGLIAPGAKVERLKTGFRFLEGPASDAEGNLVFSDPMDSKVHRLSVDGKFSVFREKTDMDNGQYFDAQGNVVSCATTARALVSVAPDGKRAVLADQHEGKPFNSPNDLWIDPKGGVYFTDPRYNIPGLAPVEQDGEHVYYLAPGSKKAVRVVNDMVRPNGLIGTDDGKTLYIADHGANKTYSYSVQADGTLAGKKLFAPQGSDGVTMDERGNVYLTGYDVRVYSPQGKLIEVIATPPPPEPADPGARKPRPGRDGLPRGETPANITFAGKDHKTLFICARTSLYSIRMAVRGHKLACEGAGAKAKTAGRAADAPSPRGRSAR